MATRKRKLDTDIVGILEGPQSWADAAWRLANDLQDTRNALHKAEHKVKAAEDALYTRCAEHGAAREQWVTAEDARMAKAISLYAKQDRRIRGLRKALRQMQSHYGYGALREQIATLQAEKDALLRVIDEHNNLKAFNAALMNEAVNGK